VQYNEDYVLEFSRTEDSHSPQIDSALASERRAWLARRFNDTELCPKWTFAHACASAHGLMIFHHDHSAAGDQRDPGKTRRFKVIPVAFWREWLWSPVGNP
jgi:hypothetical protein